MQYEFQLILDLTSPTLPTRAPPLDPAGGLSPGPPRMSSKNPKYVTCTVADVCALPALPSAVYIISH